MHKSNAQIKHKKAQVRLNVFWKRNKETKEEDFLQDSTAFELVGTSKGFDADTQFNTFLQEEFVVLYRQTNNSVRLDLQSTYGYNILFEDEGKRNNVIINNGSDVIITIKQQWEFYYYFYCCSPQQHSPSTTRI